MRTSRRRLASLSELSQEMQARSRRRKAGRARERSPSGQVRSSRLRAGHLIRERACSRRSGGPPDEARNAFPSDNDELRAPSPRGDIAQRSTLLLGTNDLTQTTFGIARERPVFLPLTTQGVTRFSSSSPSNIGRRERSPRHRRGKAPILPQIALRRARGDGVAQFFAGLDVRLRQLRALRAPSRLALAKPPPVNQKSPRWATVRRLRE